MGVAFSVYDHLCLSLSCLIFTCENALHLRKVIGEAETPKLCAAARKLALRSAMGTSSLATNTSLLSELPTSNWSNYAGRCPHDALNCFRILETWEVLAIVFFVVAITFHSLSSTSFFAVHCKDIRIFRRHFTDFTWLWRRPKFSPRWK